jgi:hypothetical protein
MRGKPFEPGDPRAGRPRGRANNRTVEVRDLCRRLLTDPGYLEALKERLKTGKAGALEPILWQYAFGSPPVYVQPESLEELLDGLPY